MKENSFPYFVAELNSSHFGNLDYAKDMITEAKNAGADHAGLDELIKKVKDGWMEFDVALATTDSMKSVRSIAKLRCYLPH